MSEIDLPAGAQKIRAPSACPHCGCRICAETTPDVITLHCGSTHDDPDAAEPCPWREEHTVDKTADGWVITTSYGGID